MENFLTNFELNNSDCASSTCAVLDSGLEAQATLFKLLTQDERPSVLLVKSQKEAVDWWYKLYKYGCVLQFQSPPMCDQTCALLTEYKTRGTFPDVVILTCDILDYYSVLDNTRQVLSNFFNTISNFRFVIFETFSNIDDVYIARSYNIVSTFDLICKNFKTCLIFDSNFDNNVSACSRLDWVLVEFDKIKKQKFERVILFNDLNCLFGIKVKNIKNKIKN